MKSLELLWHFAYQLTSFLNSLIQISLIRWIGKTSRPEKFLDSLPRDRIFVMGSAASIDHLSNSQWEQISRGVTIGMNYWVRQQFVPTIYFVEGASKPWLNRVSTPLDVLIKDPELRRKTPVFFFGKDILYGLVSGLRAYRAGLKVLPYPAFSMRVASTRVVRTSIVMFFKLAKRFRPGSFVCLNGSSSLSRIITGLLVSGFKEIVLVGIDLRGAYSVSDPHAHRQEVLPDRSLSDSVHRTDRSSLKSLRASRFTALVAHEARKLGFGRVLNGSPTSVLADQIDEFQWR